MGDNLSLDHAISAVRAALAAAHDLRQLNVRRTAAPDTYITVTHCPDPAANHNRADQHAAYTATLQEAGWDQPLNLGPLVLIPGIPPSDTAPDTYTAAWATTLDGHTDPVDAAYEARGQQHDYELTEAVWTVTDATGRPHVIITDDNPEPEHTGHVEPHIPAYGHAHIADLLVGAGVTLPLTILAVIADARSSWQDDLGGKAAASQYRHCAHHLRQAAEALDRGEHSTDEEERDAANALASVYIEAAATHAREANLTI